MVIDICRCIYMAMRCWVSSSFRRGVGYFVVLYVRKWKSTSRLGAGTVLHQSGVVETLTKSLRIQNPRYNKSLVLEAWLLLHAMPTWEGWNWYKCMTFAHQDRPDYPIEAQQCHDGPSHKQIEELSSHLYPSHLPYYSGIVTRSWILDTGYHRQGVMMKCQTSRLGSYKKVWV